MAPKMRDGAPVPTGNGIISMPVFQQVTSLQAANAQAMFFGFSVTVSLIEVDLTELRKAHLLMPNSPFVAAACGKWEERTKVWCA